MINKTVIANVLCYIAGFLIIVSNLVQLRQIYKLKNANGISYVFIIMVITYALLFVIYGILLDLLLLTSINAISTIEMFGFLYLKIYYSRSKKYSTAQWNKLNSSPDDFDHHDNFNQHNYPEHELKLLNNEDIIIAQN
jgi:uncharacterized protein with PQ loop repeat